MFGDVSDGIADSNDFLGVLVRYLDGELLDVPASIVEIEIAEKQLKVYS